ncbi:MAG TPA: hypothetical protein VGL71_07900, partial [Urbifossiella sp.]
ATVSRRPMNAVTFDTLKFANTLKSAGVPSQQAEAQAVAFAEVIQLNFQNLVTKDDLELAKRELRQDIALVKQELSAKIDTSNAKQSGDIYLVKWMFGATFSVVLAVFWLLIRLSFSKTP